MSLETEINKRILHCGFKHHRCKENKRLGVLRTFITDDGRFIEMYNERGSWYSLFFYGIGDPKRYLPLSIDLLEKSDLIDLEKFLKHHFGCAFT